MGQFKLELADILPVGGQVLRGQIKRAPDFDLVNLLIAWGTADPAADLNGDGVVTVQDLIKLIVSWGPCG